jgi:RNA-directed DNA polymerase
MSGDVQVRFCERPGVRFPRATHLVIGFEREDDARRVMAVLGKRFARFGLRLHPEKTRLFQFRRPWDWESRADEAQSFDFLGFTVITRRSHKGRWAICFLTRKARQRRAMGSISEWCRRHRHLPTAAQHATLSRKLEGHLNYFAVSGNALRVKALCHRMQAIWFKWLRRRGQRRPFVGEHVKPQKFEQPGRDGSFRAA